MKVAFFVGVFPSTSETFILNQITGMIDAGHDVEIFAWRPQLKKTVHADVLRYTLLDKVSYARLPENKLLRIIKAMLLFIAHFPKNRPLLCATLDTSRFGKEASSLRLFYLALLFLKKKFDIIHCHYGFNGVLGVYLKELGLVAKVVTTFHAYDMTAYLDKYGSGVYKDLFIRGDMFLPVSEYWRKKLLSLGCPSHKSRVHHMGIDTDKVTYSDAGYAQGPVTLLTVGRLIEKKGHQYVIRALSRLVKNGRRITYLIAGDGPLRKQLESLVAQEGLQENARFLGWQTQEEVLRLYSQAHIFVLASVTTQGKDMEGIPLVLIEAQGAGLPVVSTYHSGIPELVSDGVSGLLVGERDTFGLTEKIEYLIDNPQARAEMGKRGREIVSQRFNIKTLNATLAALYREIR